MLKQTKFYQDLLKIIKIKYNDSENNKVNKQLVRFLNSMKVLFESQNNKFVE